MTYCRAALFPNVTGFNFSNRVFVNRELISSPSITFETTRFGNNNQMTTSVAWFFLEYTQQGYTILMKTPSKLFVPRVACRGTCGVKIEQRGEPNSI